MSHHRRQSLKRRRRSRAREASLRRVLQAFSDFLDKRRAALVRDMLEPTMANRIYPLAEPEKE